MLGNDVVDLRLAKTQSNWTRKNYLSKIFSVDEQSLIHTADDPDVFVWLMWSMKEACYKIVNRKTGLRFYKPMEFRCTFTLNGSTAEGLVHYSGETFLTYTEISPDYLHSISFNTGSDRQQCKIIRMKNSPDYEYQLQLGHPEIKLRKNISGIPEIFLVSSMSSHCASVSHHGVFCFIAYLLDH